MERRQWTDSMIEKPVCYWHFQDAKVAAKILLSEWRGVRLPLALVFIFRNSI
jgi:hypothetical protein